MSRKILCILSEWGFWGEEPVGPLDALDKHGYEVVFATNRGKHPLPLPPSEDPDFIDPPLGRTVTSVENARKTRELSQSGRLDSPLSLTAWLPGRSTGDSYMTGQVLIEMLENGFRRYGWHAPASQAEQPELTTTGR